MIMIKKINKTIVLRSKTSDFISRALVKSPEYIQFVQAREKLEADNEQSTILNELRQRQMSLGMAAMMGEEQTEETEDFEKLYLSLVNNPVISDYLFAEGRLFHLISDVEEVLAKVGIMAYAGSGRKLRTRFAFELA